MSDFRQFEKRLPAWSLFFLLLYLGAFLWALSLDVRGDGRNPSPPGVDFALFYAAGEMVREGRGEEIYQEEAHHEAVEGVLERETPARLPWLYPPSFLLLILPLTFLPYTPALLLWLAGTLGLMLWSAWGLGEGKGWPQALLLAGFPGVFLNLRWGQNAFLTTALLGLSLHHMGKRPVLAGLFLGLLSFKPQLAFFPLLLLIFSKAWRELFWAALFSLLTVLLSGLLLGFGLWLAFFRSLGASSQAALEGAWKSVAAIQPTVQTALRIWGVEGRLLTALVLLIGGVAFFSVLWIWRKSTRPALKGGAVVLGLFLASPYFLQYDLMLLGIPFLLLLKEFREKGGGKGEWLLLALLWITPLASWILVAYTHFQITPLVLGGTLGVLFLRVRREKERCDDEEHAHE